MQKRVIQVPMDADLLKALDEESKGSGRPRSEVIRKACKDYLRRLENERLEREYAESYRQMPETEEEKEWVGAQMKMVGEVLEPEDWSDVER